jgi:hypothetical protein
MHAYTARALVVHSRALGRSDLLVNEHGEFRISYEHRVQTRSLNSI